MEVTTPAGILKKTPLKRSIPSEASGQGSLGSPTSQRNGVHWQVPNNLEDLLERAASKGGADKATVDELEGLMTHMRHQKGPALIEMLLKIQQNISMVKPRLENFVSALLRVGWADQEKPVVVVFMDFLVNLVTAHIYYTKPVVKMLMCNLLGVTNRAAIIASSQESVDFDGIENRVFESTHETLKHILKAAPLAGRSALLQYAKECSPYAMTADSRAHTNYFSNVLAVSLYTSSQEKLALLTLVVDRLVLLDAYIDKEIKLPTSGDEGPKGSMTQDNARANLDYGMVELVKYIDRHFEGDVELIKSLHSDLLSIFDTHLLPAHTGHVQFAMFYLLGRRPALSGNFLEWLWKKFTCPNTPSVIRQATMSYLSGFASRAKFVGVQALMACMEKMSCWIHAYIDSCSAASAIIVSSSAISSHGPFYAACQALFYMFAFRHEELVASKKHLAFMRSLHLNTIVTSRLNPLYFCLPHVVSSFATIARNYQLAYCVTIMQRNSRISIPVVSNIWSPARTSSSNLLDAFFPFDPYGLTESKSRFTQFYREYNGVAVAEEESDDDDEHNGDEFEGFLAELEENDVANGPEPKRKRSDSVLSSGSLDFSYGTSPGFRD